jgi:hypothetical protein
MRFDITTGIPVPDVLVTASEEAQRICIVELMLLLYYEDPDSLMGPEEEPRKTWDGMLGSTHAEYVGAGVAVLWP